MPFYNNNLLMGTFVLLLLLTLSSSDSYVNRSIVLILMHKFGIKLIVNFFFPATKQCHSVRSYGRLKPGLVRPIVYFLILLSQLSDIG